MQTFLPYPSFERSASVLDQKRLGKQRVETLQIATALVHNRGWIHHPAVKMWSGYLGALLEYQRAVCHEWSEIRGHQDTCMQKTEDLILFHGNLNDDLPYWFGSTEFHKAHQSNLVRKDPDYYRQYFPQVPDDLPYVWPKPPLKGEN